MVNLRCSSKSPFALKINRKKYTFKELYLTERITADHLKVFAVFLRGGELDCLPCSVELPVSSPSHNNNNKTLKRKQGMSLASPEKQQIPVLLRASSPHINGLGVLSCLAKKKTNSDRWIVRPALPLFGITSVTTNWLSQTYFWYIHWPCPKKGSPQSDAM